MDTKINVLQQKEESAGYGLMNVMMADKLCFILAHNHREMNA